MKPNFSLVLITKNEEKTLPRLFESLKEFKEKGGETVIVDTGSTDNTVQIAKDFGCIVEEVGDRFVKTIDKELADRLNRTFIRQGEEPIVKEGTRYFVFSEAKNYAASLASNDMIYCIDADEVPKPFNIDVICDLINEGFTQFEYQHVFDHDEDGDDRVKFVQTKFFNRKEVHWEHTVHEMLHGKSNKMYLDEKILKLNHYQNLGTGRGQYIVGLAIDCLEHPESDRHCYYFARELYWSNRLHSALAQFSRHYNMEVPPPEYGSTPRKEESAMYIGNILGRFGQLDQEVEWYKKAMEFNLMRREPVLKLAQFYQWHRNTEMARQYAEMALRYEWNMDYGISKKHFFEEPQEILDWAIFTSPKVSIIVPTLGREKKLEQLLESIKENAGYKNYEIIVKQDQFPPDNIGVPKLLKQGVEESTGDLVMYLGNDCLMKKDCVKNAVKAMQDNFPKMDGLIGLNDGYWFGEVFTHWMAGKRLLPLIGGEFFHTGYFHTGCDSELTQMARKLNKAFWAEEARIYHDHPVQPNFKDPIDEVYKLAYDPQRREHDNQLYHERAKLLGFEFVDNFRDPTVIPKKIFTIWLNDKPVPKEVLKCISTQHLDGFEHKLITLDNCYKSKYVEDCLSRNDAIGWVKASDYLRMWYLYNEGGIYLDADTEVLKPFGLELLSCHLFACQEDNGFVANGIIGAEKGHPVIKRCLDVMDTLDGKSDKVFENGMEVWNYELDKFGDGQWVKDKILHIKDPKQICIYPQEYFLPYNHETGITNITDNSYTTHRYLKSWK